MRVIGLTGGIGSGKSTVGRLLSEAGAVVIDADQAARDVVAPGQPALAEITERFGPGVVQADGTLDRPVLAAIVFADQAEREALEAITHPRIGARIQEQIDAAAAAERDDGHDRLVVVEHPLLVETGLAAGYEVVVVVLAPVEVRVRRLVERGLDEQDARARIAAQATDEQRRAAATHLVDNGGDLDHLHEQVAALAGELGLAP